METYPVDAGDPHLLSSILSTIKLARADGLQLQLLAFGHGGLQVDAGELGKVAGVAETREQLHGVRVALELERDL